jgi:hypothetical protein
MRRGHVPRARVCFFLLLHNARQPTIGTCGMWRGGRRGRTEEVGWQVARRYRRKPMLCQEGCGEGGCVPQASWGESGQAGVAIFLAVSTEARVEPGCAKHGVDVLERGRRVLMECKHCTTKIQNLNIWKKKRYRVKSDSRPSPSQLILSDIEPQPTGHTTTRAQCRTAPQTGARTQSRSSARRSIAYTLRGSARHAAAGMRSA